MKRHSPLTEELESTDLICDSSVTGLELNASPSEVVIRLELPFERFDCDPSSSRELTVEYSTEMKIE